MSPEEGARVYSQVTVQRALLEVSRCCPRRGPGWVSRARRPGFCFSPRPPGQRGSVRAGGGDGEAEEEGGRRLGNRGYLTIPGCSARSFQAAPCENGLCRLPPPTEDDPWRRLQICSGSGLPPTPWSLLSERTGQEWGGKGPHSGALRAVTRHPDYKQPPLRHCQLPSLLYAATRGPSNLPLAPAPSPYLFWFLSQASSSPAGQSSSPERAVNTPSLLPWLPKATLAPAPHV